MFHVDSTTQRIDRYEFDAAAGELGARLPFATVDPTDGLPDSLCADAEWCVGEPVRRRGCTATTSAVCSRSASSSP